MKLKNKYKTVITTVKEKLYKGIIKRELKEKYEEDKFGMHCMSCGGYAPINKPLNHYRRCPTAQMERAIAL